MPSYQPYRRSIDRPQTPALSAMLLGRPAISPNIIDQWRQLARRKRRGLHGYLVR